MGVQIRQQDTSLTIGVQEERLSLGADTAFYFQGGGGCIALEQHLLLPETVGLTPITPSDIAAKWRSIYANHASVPSHSSQPLLTIQTDKQDSALEQQYNIADTIQVVTMSSQEIKDKFNDIYTTLR